MTLTKADLDLIKKLGISSPEHTRELCDLAERALVLEEELEQKKKAEAAKAVMAAVGTIWF